MTISRAGIFCVVFIMLCAARLPALADDPTPATIFKNHATAVGYSLLDGDAKPFVMDATSTWYDYNGGRHTSDSVLTQSGTYFREDDTYAGSTNSAGFDGTDFWLSSDNASLTANTGYARPFDVTWAVVNAEGFDSTLSAEMRKGSRSAYVVRIHPVGGMPADVYFDRSTWLIDQVIVDPDGDSIREEFADYKQFGTIQVAMTRRVNSTTTIVTKFSWDAKVTADQLSAPSTEADTVSFPASGTSTMSFDPHGGVVVEASVNGVAGRFTLDPMTPGILIDPLMAQRAGLIKSATDAHFAYDKPFDTAALPATTVQVGGLTFKNCHVRLFSNNFDFHSQPYDGYLGLDVLEKADASINYDTDTLTFTNPAQFTAPSDDVMLPIALDGGVAQVIAMVNGSKKVYMQLGLSMQTTAYFWQTYLERNPDVAFRAGGFGGVMKSLALGPFEQDNVRAVSLRFPAGESFETGANGILGSGVLDAFNLVIDYPDHKLFVTPRKRHRP